MNNGLNRGPLIAAGTLQAPVCVDLFLDLRERRNRNLVRVLRKITMRAMKRTVARAESEATVRQVPAGNLIVRPEFQRERFPSLLEDPSFLFGNRMPECFPARPPARRRRLQFGIVGERNHLDYFASFRPQS